MHGLQLTGQQAAQPGTMTIIGESAATAAASQAKAMVEARYVIAMHRPRNWDQVRQDLLRECRRPSFANNKSAYYRKPIGQGVEGLGIRFVEVALRCMTNVLIETSMIFEDAGKEVHRVSVTDLESNITYPMDVRVARTVERSKPADDGSYISVRKNSYNKDVYTVPANDDDLLNKRAAQISKAIRTLGLRIIPGDLCDEAEAIIKAIRLDEAARDPLAERKKIVDAFDSIGVKASQLTEYLGHDIGSCSPNELVDLRGLFGAIRDGEATWATVMENKAESGAAAKPAAAPTAAAPTAQTSYSQEQFDKSLPGWKKLIADGKKTAAQIIATAESKAPLTDAQKAAINGTGAAEPVVTFAQVADGLAKAKDRQALDDAASLIGEVANPEHRKELTATFEARQGEFAENP